MSHNPLRRVVAGLGIVGVLVLGALFVAPTFAAGADADLSQTLHVSMKFTQATYHANDTVRLTMTLTNSDSKPLLGVQAACGHIGDPNELKGTGLGWTPLVADSPGIELKAGEIRTVDVSEALPAAAADLGVVQFACTFGPNAATSTVRLPSVAGSARVLGVTLDYVGSLDDGSHPIANTKVYAVDPDTKEIFARAATDAAGNFTFKGIYAGIYQIYVVGPWQNADGKPIITMIRKQSTLGVPAFTLRPGPEQQDLERAGGTTAPTTSMPTTSATSTAAGGGAGGTATPTSTAAATTTTPASTTTMTLPKRLPNTGANVFVPIVAGLALLAAGVGALLIARRRRATS